MTLGLIAVVLAGTGTAAAARLVTGKDIKNQSITGSDIRNATLSTAKLSAGARSALQGQMGPAGPQGAAGPAGSSAISGLTVECGSLAVAANAIDAGTVYCAPGQRVVSGGFFSDYGFMFGSKPNDDRSGWTVALDNTGFPAAELEAYALCAGNGQAIAATKGRSRITLRPVTGTAKAAVAMRGAARTGEVRGIPDQCNWSGNPAAVLRGARRA